MSSTFDRRSFLTHSAATLGGVAMAGSVVDGLLADVAGGGGRGEQGQAQAGGTLTVGTLSDVPNYHIFNGSQGKMDASGFCVANALYDPLFVTVAERQGRCSGCWRSPPTEHQLHGVDDRASPRRATSTTATNVQRHRLRGRTTPPPPPTRRSDSRSSPSSLRSRRSTSTPSHTTWSSRSRPFPISLAEQQIAYMAPPSSLRPDLRRQSDRDRSLQGQVLEVGVESQFVRKNQILAQGRRRPSTAVPERHQLQDDRRPGVPQPGPRRAARST